MALETKLNSVGLLVSSELIFLSFFLSIISRSQFWSIEESWHGVVPKTQLGLRMGEQFRGSLDIVFQVQWQQLHFCLGYHNSSWKSAGLRYFFFENMIELTFLTMLILVIPTVRRGVIRFQCEFSDPLQEELTMCIFSEYPSVVSVDSKGATLFSFYTSLK